VTAMADPSIDGSKPVASSTDSSRHQVDPETVRVPWWRGSGSRARGARPVEGGLIRWPGLASLPVTLVRRGAAGAAPDAGQGAGSVIACSWLRICCSWLPTMPAAGCALREPRSISCWAGRTLSNSPCWARWACPVTETRASRAGSSSVTPPRPATKSWTRPWRSSRLGRGASRRR